MTDPWFSAETAPFFSFFALLAVLDSLGVWARQGRHRRLVEWTWNAAFGLGALGTIAGAVAWLVGQPAHVWLTLAFVGGVTASVFFRTRLQVRRWYQEAELRQTVAADL